MVLNVKAKDLYYSDASDTFSYTGQREEFDRDDRKPDSI